MRKRTPTEVLKGFSWTYVFFAVIEIILAIIVLCIKEFPEEIKALMPQNLGLDIKNYLLAIFITSALLASLYFWLARRVANGKSRGTLYIVLLIIGLIGNICATFTGTRTSTVNLVINAVALYFVIKVRKENN